MYTNSADLGRAGQKDGGSQRGHQFRGNYHTVLGQTFQTTLVEKVSNVASC